MRLQRFNASPKSIPLLGSPARRRRRPWAPRLEALEGRLVLSTLTVTNAADSGTGSLRAAISAAGSGDTIVFASRIDGRTIALTSGELAIGQSLTIKGPGAGLLDVDAGGSSRVFDITSSSATVTISGVTVSGGTSETGGGIFDQGAALTLKNDTLSNDQAVGVNPGDTATGGGVEVTDSGSLAVQSCVFQGDLAQGAAGPNGGSGFVNGQGGDGDGGAIFADSGTSLSVSGSTFRQNQAVGGPGGSGGTGFENDFGGNSNGGAIDTMSNAFSVTGSAFSGDLALGGAGGLGQSTEPFAANGFGGYALGIVNINSFTGTSTFNFNGDTFTHEKVVGGAGAAMWNRALEALAAMGVSSMASSTTILINRCH